jgi:hypothetical protein
LRFALPQEAAASPSATTPAFCPGPGFADIESPFLELFSFKPCDGRGAFFLICHFYESEPAGLSAEFVFYQSYRRDFPESSKFSFKVFLCHFASQIADKNVHMNTSNYFEPVIT